MRGSTTEGGTVDCSLAQRRRGAGGVWVVGVVVGGSRAGPRLATFLVARCRAVRFVCLASSNLAAVGLGGSDATSSAAAAAGWASWAGAPLQALLMTHGELIAKCHRRVLVLAIRSVTSSVVVPLRPVSSTVMWFTQRGVFAHLISIVHLRVGRELCLE